MSCEKCKVLIEKSEEKILCHTCKIVCVHVICVKNSISKVGRRPKWICDECTNKKQDNNSQSEASDTEDTKSINDLYALITKRFDKVEKNVELIPELKESVEFLSQKYDEMIVQLDNQDKTIKKLNKDVGDLNDKIKHRDNFVLELTARVEELEQAKLGMNVEVHNLPMLPQENTLEVADRIAAALGAPPVSHSVEDAYRVYSNPNNARKAGIPPILVVKFKAAEARGIWLNRKRTADLTVGAVNNNNVVEKVRVYEMLTPRNRSLLWKAKTMAKTKGFKFVWVRNGKIFARFDENEGTTRIRNENDVSDMDKHS